VLFEDFQSAVLADIDFPGQRANPAVLDQQHEPVICSPVGLESDRYHGTIIPLNTLGRIPIECDSE